ncbi:MAG: lysophospholipid acyltransferase family protein [Thermotogota bacterium]
MNKKHVAPADTFVWRTAEKILYPIFDKFLDIKVEKEVKLPEPPFLLVANHTHFLDGFFLSYAIDKPISWVVAKGNFDNKVLGWALKSIGSISKQKNKPDMLTIRNIYRTFQKKGIVGIFPEGSVAWDGVFGNVAKGTDKFIDRMKVPIVAAQVFGGYLSKPRWADKSRKGPIVIKLDVFESKEALNYINVSEWDWQNKKKNVYKGKNKAKGLKRIIWFCPNCNSFHSFEYHNNSMVCSKCNFTLSVDKYGYVNGKSVKEALVNQKKILKEKYIKSESFEFKKVELIHFSGDNKNVLKGDMKYSKGYLYINGIKIDMKKIKNESTFLKKIFEFFYEGDLYRLKTNNSSLLLKNLCAIVKEEDDVLGYD